MAARTVAGIAAQGVAANKQAAGYAMAQALQARNIVTAETLAGLTGQLYQTAMEYNMQWEMWKKQQDYAAKLAEKEGQGNKADAMRLINEGGDIGADAANTLRDIKNEVGEDFDPAKDVNITDLATTYANENGYDPAGPEVTLYINILRRMKSGANVDVAMEQSYQSLFGSYPGFNKWGDAVIGGAAAQAQIGVAQSALDQWVSANPDAWWLEEDTDREDLSILNGVTYTPGSSTYIPVGKGGMPVS